MTVVLIATLEGISSFVLSYSNFREERIIAERLHTEYGYRLHLLQKGQKPTKAAIDYAKTWKVEVYLFWVLERTDAGLRISCYPSTFHPPVIKSDVRLSLAAEGHYDNLE